VTHERVRHRPALVLALTACAVPPGATSLPAVGEWIAGAPEYVLGQVGADQAAGARASVTEAAELRQGRGGPVSCSARADSGTAAVHGVRAAMAARQVRRVLGGMPAASAALRRSEVR